MEAGLDQVTLAELAGLSRATVSNAERGVGVPQRASLEAWAAACGVSPEWLLQAAERERVKPGPKPR